MEFIRNYRHYIRAHWWRSKVGLRAGSQADGLLREKEKRKKKQRLNLEQLKHSGFSRKFTRQSFFVLKFVLKRETTVRNYNRK